MRQALWCPSTCVIPLMLLVGIDGQPRAPSICISNKFPGDAVLRATALTKIKVFLRRTG